MEKPPTPDEQPEPAPDDIPLPDFAPVPVRARCDGWTAYRQRRFIQALAETGLVGQAAAAAGMSVRSVNRLALRHDAEAFNRAWSGALAIAARRGHSLLLEYAYQGPLETVWRDGKIVYQRRKPSERALIFLLRHLAHARFGRVPPPDQIEPDHDSVKPFIDDYELLFEGLTDLPDDEVYGEPGETAK